MENPIEKRYTVEEFFLFEERLDAHNFEYLEGFIYDKENDQIVPSEVVDQVLNPDVDIEELNYQLAMISKNHLILSRKMSVRLFAYFEKNKDLDLVFYTEGTSLKVKGTKKFRKPDMVVVKESEEIMDRKKGVLDNPLLIIEFGSPSTSGEDHDDKLTEYFYLDSVKEYILINSQTPFVRQYTRISGKKLLCTYYDSLEEILLFETFGFAISLTDLYEKCEF